MIGVLVLAGILGYAVLYSGVADLKVPGGYSIGQALLGKGGTAQPSDFPKPTGAGGTVGAPRRGRTP